MRISYNASMEKGLSLNGDAERVLLQQEDGTWLFRTNVDSFIADIDESLELRWEDGQVIPLRYRYKLSGLFVKNREQAIDFDWEAGNATGHYRGKPFSMKLKNNTLDPMGYQLQLLQDIKAGKTRMSYSVLEKARYDEDVFAIVGEERIDTGSGALKTVKAEKVREDESKRETLMWFAPDQEYVLVRLLQVQPDGSRYEITLDQARFPD
ncbi:MAG: DUF3108 domain-containing protein [Gammaproteobacteria bacterium]|nr:DUF3108 domain-containing protein [Gammaproteobacteria bacterium]